MKNEHVETINLKRDEILSIGIVMELCTYLLREIIS